MNAILEPDSKVGSGVYTKDGLTKEFRQGEILSGVVQHIYVHAEQAVRPMDHAFAMIVSQDCDLLQDYTGMREEKPSALNSVLLYEMRLFVELPSFFPTAAERKMKNRICQNNDERFQYLCEVPAELDAEGKGLPELIIDFRKFFALPVGELSRQCALPDGAKRRTRLADLYREHLQSRLAFYMQRVALPVQHSP